LEGLKSGLMEPLTKKELENLIRMETDEKTRLEYEKRLEKLLKRQKCRHHFLKFWKKDVKDD